ncbi:RagB/SusD family nutrient uptake outer membrane protein [Chitinophaga sp. GCM10012297]|uniref:RagB/SusD family nutrient uptake outer membrane protein n=1 Tax=Chitinophaga chungangae TaxID=2821488 RepID=A0ABS3Y7W7_9BACT|nr:RagB/SusD family nutrient uptake outer membrane protein [Chitinophaga chungangae]MBO9150771.1 RagB/SusD family nutrient uptake outer membrane protein [Chitinophaga chungangae]
MRYLRFIYTIAMLAAAGEFAACNKLVEATPVGRVPVEIAYVDSVAAEANVNGMYYSLQQNGNIYNGGFYAILPLLSDEAAIGNSSTSFYLELANNRLLTNNAIASGLWTNNYKTIYQANSVLENVGKVPMSRERMNRYLGEAHFVRGYCYFILSQYFGKVPLSVSTDFKTNGSLSRSDTAVINDFIMDELTQAETLLPGGFAGYGNKKIRVCRETAQAMLARVCLFRKDWANAETWATKAINSPAAGFADTYEDVLKPNSPESLWEIWAASTSYAYRNSAASMLMPSSPASTFKPAVVPGAGLLNAFEAGDKRQTAYLAFSTSSQTSYVYKYRDLQNGMDQGKILRISETYLVRAEARAMQNNVTGSGSAAEDVDKIRARAGLAGTPATTREAMVDAVMQERFVELMFENHRWLDLKRTGRIRAVMALAKPTWKPETPILLPVPAAEIGANANLLPQNEGY